MMEKYEKEISREEEQDYITTCDHHNRNLTICQSEFSIQRWSIEKRNKTAASRLGSKYIMTAKIYNGGTPFTWLRMDSFSSRSPRLKECK